MGRQALYNFCQCYVVIAKWGNFKNVLQKYCTHMHSWDLHGKKCIRFRKTPLRIPMVMAVVLLSFSLSASFGSTYLKPLELSIEKKIFFDLVTLTFDLWTRPRYPSTWHKCPLKIHVVHSYCKDGFVANIKLHFLHACVNWYNNFLIWCNKFNSWYYSCMICYAAIDRFDKVGGEGVACVIAHAQ